MRLAKLPRLTFLVTAALASGGCFGETELLFGSGSGPGSSPSAGDPDAGTEPAVGLPYVCKPEEFAGATLDSVRAEFNEFVHPMLLRDNGGCISCHGTASGRLFKVFPNADETFFAARTGGFLKSGAGSLYDRLTTPVEIARMPQGAPAWITAEAERMARVSCALSVAEEGGTLTPPDEEFPPALLTPWSGAPSDVYDTRFVDYPLLKAKVQSIFSDAWVRDSVDQFDKNIGLLGGVNYTTHFVPARTATPEFLLGLNALAPDVCQKAATDKTGPFAGINTSQTLVDTPASSTTRVEAESAATKTSGGATSGGWNLYSNGFLSNPVTFTGDGDFRFTVNARATQSGTEPAKMQIRVDGQSLVTLDVPTNTLTQYTHTATALTRGPHEVAIAFINDANDSAAGTDRNLIIDWFQVEGPLGSGTGTTRVDAAKAGLRQLHSKILYRSASTAEVDEGLELLHDLIAIPVSLPSAWAGMCEALVRHPDFLFTRPPSLDAQAGAEQKKLALVMLAQDLLGRTPTAAELTAYSSGALTWEEQVDAYLESEDFRRRYFERFRLRTESNGTPENDEPARLWTYLATQRRPMQELFTGDYSVSADFQPISRGPEHGRTGVLTMKGFINGKQGLPHYNYAARVLTDFMGVIFQVPPEVFDARPAATAASTVDSTSVCFSCHQLLTPLAHQRLKWDDEGNYRETLADGSPIDDSDREMVASYPYKGAGLEAFSTRAAKKEQFVRRTLNAQVEFVLGREMRHEEDERALYKELWDLSVTSHGDLKAILRHVLTSPVYRRH